MTGAFETPPGRRSVGPVAAYWRALLSLGGVFVLTYLVGLRVYAWSREPLKWVDTRLTLFPPEVETTYLKTLSGHHPPIDFVTYTISREFPFGFAFYVFERITWGPILAFLLAGALVALVARYRRPVRAWLDDAEPV